MELEHFPENQLGNTSLMPTLTMNEIKLKLIVYTANYSTSAKLHLPADIMCSLYPIMSNLNSRLLIVTKIADALMHLRRIVSRSSSKKAVQGPPVKPSFTDTHTYGIGATWRCGYYLFFVRRSKDNYCWIVAVKVSLQWSITGPLMKNIYIYM